jgi:hypothetical protein
LVLNRLDEANGKALVQNLVGHVGLTAEIVMKIVERADGVPLFLEELTKAVLESAEDKGSVAVVPPGKSLDERYLRRYMPHWWLDWIGLHQRRRMLRKSAQCSVANLHIH